jgi:hypothetical protein
MRVVSRARRIMVSAKRKGKHMGKLQRVCMIIAIAGITVSILAAAAMIELTATYTREAMHAPDPGTGHVVMVHDQGMRVYVTPTQKLYEDGAFALAMVAGTLAMGAFFLGQTASLPREDTPQA